MLFNGRDRGHNLVGKWYCWNNLIFVAKKKDVRFFHFSSIQCQHQVINFEKNSFQTFFILDEMLKKIIILNWLQLDLKLNTK